ncbi:MAG: hypothetical protein ACIAS6_11110 [Phycisphaerales bacterium JB060]
MNAKQLAIVSGLALTLSAGSALAQNRGNGTQQERRDRDVQQDRQDRLEDASRAVRDRDSRYGSSTNILTSLEGMWNVQVQVNRTNWNLMGSGGRESMRPRGDADESAQRRDGAQPDANNPRTERENEREVRERELRDRQDRRQQQEGRQQDDDRQTRTATRTQDQQMANADGMARSHAILDGDILRTTVIFGEGMGSTTDRPDRDAQRGIERNNDRQRGAQPDRGQTPTSTRGGAMDNRSLQSVSFLGYNDNTGQYNMALMTGQGGAIHYFTGKYDQAGRRIVFTSDEQRSGATGQRNPSSTTERDGGTTTTQGQTQNLGSGMTVVLQMEGSDSYTVTAYRGSTSVSTVTGAGADLGGQPDQRRDDGSDRDQDQRQDRYGGDATIAPNVIYKATYTKADASMRSQNEQRFEEHDRRERGLSIRER